MNNSSSYVLFDVLQFLRYKNDPEILAMTNLIAAYQRNEILEFEKILKVKLCHDYIIYISERYIEHAFVIWLYLSRIWYFAEQ